MKSFSVYKIFNVRTRKIILFKTSYTQSLFLCQSIIKSFAVFFYDILMRKAFTQFVLPFRRVNDAQCSSFVNSPCLIEWNEVKLQRFFSFYGFMTSEKCLKNVIKETEIFKNFHLEKEQVLYEALEYLLFTQKHSFLLSRY